jgi:hypothetical protein
MGLCYILTWYIVRKYFFVYVWTVETGNSFRIFYLISLGLIPIYLCVHALYRFYHSSAVKNNWNGLFTICKANFISVFLFGAILYLGGRNTYVYMFPKSFNICFYFISILMVVIERSVFLILEKKMQWWIRRWFQWRIKNISDRGADMNV